MSALCFRKAGEKVAKTTRHIGKTFGFQWPWSKPKKIPAALSKRLGNPCHRWVCDLAQPASDQDCEGGGSKKNSPRQKFSQI